LNELNLTDDVSVGGLGWPFSSLTWCKKWKSIETL